MGNKVSLLFSAAALSAPPSDNEPFFDHVHDLKKQPVRSSGAGCFFRSNFSAIHLSAPALRQCRLLNVFV
jgi:hypothetical protein